MIGRLRGELIQKRPNLALVECGGVGYACLISLSTYGLLPEAGREAILHTELVMRENELSLVGFATSEERELYRMLIKVDGVGPKLALAALGAMPTEDLIRSLAQREVTRLTKIPGVGKKTAEKLCFELSEKMGGLSGLDGLGPAALTDRWELDLSSALTNLGFKSETVAPVVARLSKEGKPAMGEALRLALKALQG